MVWNSNKQTQSAWGWGGCPSVNEDEDLQQCIFLFYRRPYSRSTKKRKEKAYNIYPIKPLQTKSSPQKKCVSSNRCIIKLHCALLAWVALLKKTNPCKHSRRLETVAMYGNGFEHCFRAADAAAALLSRKQSFQISPPASPPGAFHIQY